MDDERAAWRAYWNERHAAREPIESHEPNPILVAEAEALVPGRALDLGAGDGTTAVWLALHGWQVTAIDFSSVALDRARGLAAGAGVEVTWIEADLLDRAPSVSGFDLVTLLHIHLPPPERRLVLAWAAEALAPGGVLLVIGHDRANLTEGVGGPQDPEVLYTPAEIAADLPGLNIERAETVWRPRPEGRARIDAVVRARLPD